MIGRNGTPLLAGLLFLVGGALSAQERISIDVQISTHISWYEITIEGEPPVYVIGSPAIAVGMATTLEFSSLFSFAPALDVFINEKRFNNHSDIVVPASAGRGGNLSDAVPYMGLLVSLPAIFSFSLSDQLALGIALSPSFLLHIPLRDNAATTTITNYLYSDGRFFYPETQLRLAFEFQDIEMQLSARLLLPFYNLWDRDNSSFIHEMIVLVTFQTRFFLPSASDG